MVSAATPLICLAQPRSMLLLFYHDHARVHTFLFSRAHIHSPSLTHACIPLREFPLPPLFREFLEFLRSIRPNSPKTMSPNARDQPIEGIWPTKAVDQSIIQQSITKFKHRLEGRFASMKDAFMALDKDRNGSLSKDEFATVLRGFGIKVSDQELDAIVARYDTNCDGRVSHAEFLKVMAC